MASQITVTAKVGPGSTVTAQVIRNVTNVNFDLAKNVMSVVTLDSPNNREFDIAASTTLTCTITAGANAAFVVS